MPSPNLTKVDICNLALANCGQKNIATLDDQNELARQCRRWYDITRRKLLRECNWTFARRVITLSLIGSLTGAEEFPDWATAGTDSDDDDDDESNDVTEDNAVFPWAYLYQYPPNVLFVHQVYNERGFSLPIYPGLDQGLEWPSVPSPWGGDPSAYELIRSKKTNELAIACNLQNAIAKYTFDTTDVSQFDPVFADALALKMADRIVIPLTGDKELKGSIQADLKDAMTEAWRLNLSENPETGPRMSSYERVRDSI